MRPEPATIALRSFAVYRPQFFGQRPYDAVFTRRAVLKSARTSSSDLDPFFCSLQGDCECSACEPAATPA
jgi:hypothetical protein